MHPRIPRSKVGLVPIDDSDELRLGHVVDPAHPLFYLCGLPHSEGDERAPLGHILIHKFCGNAYAGLQLERKEQA